MIGQDVSCLSKCASCCYSVDTIARLDKFFLLNLTRLLCYRYYRIYITVSHLSLILYVCTITVSSACMIKYTIYMGIAIGAKHVSTV